jgi:hypothetical protein
MKTLSIILFSVSALAFFTTRKALNNSTSKTGISMARILVLNTNADDAVAFTDDEFWHFEADFDTIDIKGNSILRVIENSISNLTKVEWYPHDPKTEFEHGSALICWHRGYQDTIFSDSHFRYLKKGDTIYTDSTGKFEELFKNFKVY